MFYDHKSIEAKWQQYWKDHQTFAAKEAPSSHPKYYVLDMFPYPSGAGLHVGHPLGYIASDIIARFKRHQGYNVLHPVGYDSFGLPAEQYAIQTGQHPAVTTQNNINRYEEQLRKIGFSFDWSREIRTSDPAYYRWTQWIFIQLFDSWYNRKTNRAESISSLVAHFEQEGNQNLEAACTSPMNFSAQDWTQFSEEEKQQTLLNYRLAYRAETTVNWCPELGTVLANDEVKDGKSERGGFPVYQKKMLQWSMRITAYADRLLQGLNHIDWPQPLKDAQEYWIGKSQGASVKFLVDGCQLSVDGDADNQPPATDNQIEVFTTRPDTIFGATFMVLAPEHPLVPKITTEAQKNEVEMYQQATALKTERDRQADVKSVTGAFTGSYALNPFNGKKLPVYISDYVLMGYGTGAVMAVPAHDDRDHRFAKHFGLEILPVIAGDFDPHEQAFNAKDSVNVNSDFLDGLTFTEASAAIINKIEEKGIGQRRTTYRLRDAVFSRQRYWGEPIPVYYKNGCPHTLPTSALPLELPAVEKYLPTATGEPPLGNARDFAWDEENQKIVSTERIDHQTVFPLELSTMPGWAGSSWYFLRYMDPDNAEEFCNREKSDYWGQVDLYIGGSEHATGHLLYARFWNMFLKDRGYISQEEPFKKLINQGMILGMSAFVYRFQNSENLVSKIDNKNNKVFYFSSGLVQEIIKLNVEKQIDRVTELLKQYEPNLIEVSTGEFQKIHVDVSLLKGVTDELDTEAFKNWRPEFANAEFILEDGKYITEREVEKMSKSKYNVVNPDDICEEYGADCLRLYEMFLGPLEQSKPWNTQGLTGVYGFLKKFYNLYFEGDHFRVSEEPATREELKVLHTLLKRYLYDVDHFSFNTSVSQFMIAVNEFQKMKTCKREILEPLAVIISPYAPHICEELWSRLGHSTSIEFHPLPEFQEEYLKESSFEYPVSFNGKMKFKRAFPADAPAAEIEKSILADEAVVSFLEGRTPKKIIIVPNKIINIVL